MAIDSRIEFFPAAVWDDYERVAAGADGWQAQLERWGATVAVVESGDAALSARLTAAGWRTAYSDGDGVVLLAPNRS